MWPRFSYSQMGEDLIIENYIADYDSTLDHLTYLDIGTNDPVCGNNTYLFYTKGAHGVLVEPDTHYTHSIRSVRPRDTLLPVGVMSKSGSAILNVMTARSLNTFSEKQARDYCDNDWHGRQQIESQIRVPILNINDIIAKHFTKCPDILSIDVEGVDFEILNSLDLDKYLPKIICIEINGKRAEMEDLLHSRGYLTLADNNLNLIFGRI